MGAGPNHVLGPVSRADRALLQRGGWPRGDPLPAVSPSLTYIRAMVHGVELMAVEWAEGGRRGSRL